MGRGVMRRWFSAGILLAAAGLALAADKVPAAPGAARLSAAPAAILAAPERLFVAAQAFNGVLGAQKIQVTLRQKPDMREGLEGEYFLYGGSQKILLAGEYDRDGTIFLEESEDGRSVSGQWDGKLDGGAFSGTWSSFDGSLSKPFALKIIPPRVSTPLHRMPEAATAGPAKN